MSVNFPTNRPEANLGSGPLQQGDSWRYNSIEYTWVETPDGTGIWSSKGINVNPDIYIAKADLFQANGGVISGAYNGGANEFAVSYSASAGDAGTLDGQNSSYYRNADNINDGTIDDARLPDEISSDITGSAAELGDQLPSHYLDCANFTGTLSKDRLPTEIDSNTTGNAVTADTADKVANSLTINFYAPGLTPGVDNPTNSVVYDGSQTGDNAIINITDTDSATAIIDVAAGDGLSEPSANTLTVNNTVVRTGTGTSVGYAVSGTGDTRTTKLMSGDSDQLGGEDPSYYLDYDNFTNTPTIPENTDTTYSAGTGIAIDNTNNNQISVTNTIARADTNNYVINGSGTKLKAAQADQTAGTLTITQGGTTKGTFNGETNTIALDAGGGGSTQNLQDVLSTGNTSSGSDSNITLSSAGNQVALFGTAGAIELTRADGPFIDFKDDATEDFDIRISQSSDSNLVLENTIGGVYVSDPVNGIFQLKPAVSGGGGGDPLHRVTRFNVRQEMDNDSVSANVAVSRAFSWIMSNLSTPSIYFPSGKYSITSQHSLPYNTSKTQIEIYGDGGRGEGTEIVVGATINIGHPVNINNIKFTGNVNGPTLLFRRNPTSNISSNPLQDDMDSTVTNCIFGNGGNTNSVDIDYRGRNLEVKGCRFVTGGATGVAIKLSYFNNNLEPISQDELGWKRIMISDNNFHNFDAGCIELGSATNRVEGQSYFPKLRGLVVANNTMETDGLFITHAAGSNCRLEGAAITGNTIIVYKDSTPVDIQTAHACAITGNTFNGYAENGRLVNINIDTALACTVTGNVFNSPQGGGQEGGISGNTWTGCVLASNTWFGSSTGRIDINTTNNCDIQAPIGTGYVP